MGKRSTESEKERMNKLNKKIKYKKKTDTKIRIAANMLVLVKEKKTRRCYCVYIRAVCSGTEPSFCACTSGKKCRKKPGV